MSHSIRANSQTQSALLLNHTNQAKHAGREKQIKLAVWCLKDQAQMSHCKDETPADGGTCTPSWVLGEVTRALSSFYKRNSICTHTAGLLPRDRLTSMVWLEPLLDFLGQNLRRGPGI